MFTLIGSDCVDENVIGDVWNLNSHGGNGNGHTKFNVFVEKCSFIIWSNGCTQEGWHTDDEDILYGSVVTSIADLMSKGTQDLHNDLAYGKLTYMPPIMSIETICLKFVPNNTGVSAAGKITGHFNFWRRIQLRTLRE